MTKRRIAVVVGAVVALLGVFGPALTTTGSAVAATPSVPSPTVVGPITGGLHDRPWFEAPFNAADYGYSQNEYFYSGTATAYGTTEPPAPYETRMLVYAPTNPAKFSGNVIVEWDNVTLQTDLPIEFNWVYPKILASGDAYVEITAQQAGVCGNGLTGQPEVSVSGVSVPVCNPLSLKGYDPVRYAPLVHPGDTYSYDIFSQGAEALLNPTGVRPLGDLHVKHLIAIGESQSAIELDDYIRFGADAAAQVFDGFLIDADAHSVQPTSYRVPTIHLWSEESAQPVASTSGPNSRIWEVAGMAHVDAWALDQITQELTGSELDTPQVSMAQQEATNATDADYGQEGPTVTAATEFPRRFAVDAALADLETWVDTGTPAPSAPPLEFSAAGPILETAPTAPDLPIGPDLIATNINALGLIGSPLALERDAYGNAIGGLRLPVISVPVATYNGDDGVLVGTSTPFAPATLYSLYPTHADYVADMFAATKADISERYLTAQDGVSLVTMACSSAIPAWGTTPTAEQPAACQDPGSALGVG